MIKKALAVSSMLLTLSGTAFAGGKGGTEIALASYAGFGITAAKGLPLDIEFLRSNGISTYGELEFALGFGHDVRLGAELSGGLLVGLASGLSIYGSLGPAIGMAEEPNFGLGMEIGLNVDVNSSLIFIEGGVHPADSYVAVGIRL